MALITCPECGQSISDKAAACPYCGLPLQLQTDAKKSASTKKKTKYGKIVFLSIWAIITAVSIAISVFSIYSYCKNDDTAHKKNNTYQSKDETYLYEWMTKHGTLIDGSKLQYADYSNETKFILCYDNVTYVDSMKWYVECIKPEEAGYRTKIHVTLYWKDQHSPASITVSRTIKYRGYTRSLKYFHSPETFVVNGPISPEEYYGSTVSDEVYMPNEGIVTIIDDTLGLQSELDKMDWKCSSQAQSGLCEILDWLKNEFCPTANMRMSDFGYDSYK